MPRQPARVAPARRRQRPRTRGGSLGKAGGSEPWNDAQEGAPIIRVRSRQPAVPLPGIDGDEADDLAGLAVDDGREVLVARLDGQVAQAAVPVARDEFAD